MDEKIQLLHPAGKKLPRIDKSKYDILVTAIREGLNKGPLAHTGLHESVMKYLKSNKIKFEGSVEWYMECTKLDMEAHKIIERITDKSVLKFQLKKK
jgi:hypothetical protein